MVAVDNLTQTVRDIEMEVKAKLETLTGSLDQYRKETLHALGRLNKHPF